MRYLSAAAPHHNPQATEDLFGFLETTPEPETYPLVPGWKEPTTSKQAAEKVAPSAKALRAKALAEFQRVHPEALTADEVAARLGVLFWSVRPRVAELAAGGKIVRTDERGVNDSGHIAIKWRAVI